MTKGSLNGVIAFGRVALVCGPVVAILLTGCAARRPSQGEGAATAQQAIDPTVNRQRIHALWEARTRGGVPVDFCLGPGDLLTISVFRLPEMQAMRVRVSSTGSVSLPLIGEVQAAGRTQDELAAEIARQLRAGYMRNPEVTVFVEQFASQQVSVTGAVARPGLYPLSRDNRTLADVLSEAGGLGPSAGGKILFYPSDGSACPGDPNSRGGAVRLGAGTPIEIDVNEEYQPAHENPLGLPVLGGDSLVANSGMFTVDGWVEKPGALPISPGLTAFGGISAAGGAMFPADLARVELWRAESDGTRRRIEVDFAAIKEGTQKDVTLQAGDVIKVPASPTLMVPYTIYWLLTNVIRVGAGLSLTGL